MADHYKTLKIRRTATPDEVRAAYRHWAKQLHPDVNPSPEAQSQFQQVKEAYDVLNDSKKRSDYDAVLDYTERIERQREEAAAAQARVEFLRQQDAAKKAASPPPPTSGPQSKPDPSRDERRLVDLLKQSRFKDAEDLARRMVKADPRCAVGWAALGDIARSRGELQTASRHYAFAAQFDPATLLYETRHREMEEAIISKPQSSPDKVMSEESASPLPFFVMGIVGVILACWVALDRSPFPLAVGPISQWTVPLAASLLIGGVTVGVCLSAGDLIDRFFAAQGSALVKTSPAFVLAGIALLNYWAMAVLYLLTGALQHSFNKSLTRLIASGMGMLAALSLVSAMISREAAVQTLLWGGSLIYWGSLLGWLAADSLHRSRA